MTRTKKLCVSAFIIFHLLVMTDTDRSGTDKFSYDGSNPLHSYRAFLSFDNDWSLFSPLQSRTNDFVKAVVTFDDNTEDTYIIPRSGEMSLIQRYVAGQKYHLITKAIIRKDNEFIRRDVARFALRKLKKNNFYKIPVIVELYHYWDTIPKMDVSFRPFQSKASRYQSQKLYTYEVLK